MQIKIYDRGLPIDSKVAAIGLVQAYKPEINITLPDDDFVAAQASKLSAHLSSKDSVLDYSAAASSGFSSSSASFKTNSFIALMEHARVLSITQIYENGVLKHTSSQNGDKSSQDMDTLQKQNVNSDPSKEMFTITYVYGVGFRVQIEVTKSDASADIKIGTMAAQASAGKLETSIQTDIFGFSPETLRNKAFDVPDVLMHNKPFDSEAKGALNLWRSQFQAAMEEKGANSSYNPKLLRVSFTGQDRRDFSDLRKIIPAVTYVLRRLKHGDTLEQAIKFVKKSKDGDKDDLNYFGLENFSDGTLESIYQILFNAFGVMPEDISKEEINTKLKTFATKAIDSFEHMGRK